MLYPEYIINEEFYPDGIIIKAIASVRFKCKHKNCYYRREVYEKTELTTSQYDTIRTEVRETLVKSIIATCSKTQIAGVSNDSDKRDSIQMSEENRLELIEALRYASLYKLIM